MRRLRALAAAGVLLLLLAGVPTLLAATIGNPAAAWPDLRAGDLSDTVIVDVLAAVAWLAWAQFAVAILAETLAAATRIRVPARIPGVFGGQQQLIRSLVAAAFLLAPSAVPIATAHAVIAPPAATATLAVAPVADSRPVAAHAGTAQPPAAAHTSAATRAYLVREDGPGTYWDLADRFLGSGQRWTEIWHLNQGRHQSDGSVMSSPGLLRPGWSVLLPASATLPAGHPETDPQQVVVQHGDTLSGIADDHGVADWHQLWEANHGRTEPDRQRFTDPDLIRPGWTLTVPDAAATPQPAAPAPATPAQAAPDPAPPRGSDAGADAPGARPGPPPEATSSPGSSRASAASSPAATAAVPREHPVGEGQESAAPGATSTPGSVADAAAAPRHQEVEQPEPEVLGMPAAAAAVFGAGGLLLAGSLVTALARRRRRQMRYRRPGRVVAPTPVRLSRVEKALLVAPGAVDVRWLNQALRGLVQLQVAAPGARLPDVVAARLSDQMLELVLTDPDPSPPGEWQANESATRWRLQRGAWTGFDPDLGDSYPAAWPAMVSVGYSAAGDYWLLDLERVGAAALTGDPARCLDLLRFMAAELAHNTWSEQLRVTVAGFGAELSGLNPDRLEVASEPGEAVGDLARHLQATVAALQASGVDVLDGRLRDINADLWYPHVLLLAGPATGESQVADLLTAIRGRRGRVALATVTAGSVAPAEGVRWRIHVDADGRVQIPELDLDVIAQQLPADEAEQLAQLMAVTARLQDQPVPDATGEQAWQVLADASGAPRVSLLPAAAGATPTDLPRSLHVADTDTDTERILPLPAQVYLDQTATTIADVDALAPPVQQELREEVRAADPTLDADLAVWADQACPRPKLTVLGSLAVAVGGDPGADRPRRGWSTEIITYLACRPQGVTAEQLGTDLWPDDPDAATKSKVRQAVYAVRRWIGEDHLPAAISPTGGPGLYRVHGVLVDVDLFRRLRLRGVARGPAGIADLQAALALVTGPPFSDRRPGGYRWLADDPLDLVYVGMIVDVAHVVATHHLAGGRPDLAAEAAQVALAAGSSDDVALLDLVAAYDAQRRRTEADRLITQILANNGAEVEEDLPPRTAEVLRRRRFDLSQAS